MDREQAERIIRVIKDRPWIEGVDYHRETYPDGKRVQVMHRYPPPPSTEEIEAMRALGMLEER